MAKRRYSKRSGQVSKRYKKKKTGKRKGKGKRKQVPRRKIARCFSLIKKWVKK